jgi:hypothetical protein
MYVKENTLKLVDARLEKGLAENGAANTMTFICCSRGTY